MAQTDLFTAEQALTATEETPVTSASFTVVDPVTICQEGLGKNETIEIEKHNQAGNGFRPFRSGGTVRLSYNNTDIVLAAKGTYRLAIYQPLAGPVNAEVVS